MNRKQRNSNKLLTRKCGYFFERCLPGWAQPRFVLAFRAGSRVTLARQCARNRQLARYYFGLKSKRNAKRFAEVSL
jgi:hypothetical protein